MLVLPEIGGRVHGALDKTNGYKWLYWQPTIKPGLISMTGAWISGGIEWNFPHGHRPSGFMPVDHRVVKHDDGSATVWVGETEPVYRMRWLIGLTLFPGRSYLRADYVFVNPTDHRHPFQFWATGATHAERVLAGAVPRRRGDRPRQGGVLALADARRPGPLLVEERAERELVLRLAEPRRLVRHLRPPGQRRHASTSPTTA